MLGRLERGESTFTPRIERLGWEKFAGWFFGLLFVVTAVFGIGLLWSIWRSRDR